MGVRSTGKRKTRTDHRTTPSSPSTPPRRRGRREDHFSLPGEPRDWAALHHDLLYQIFSRLPQADILRGAGLVCAAWRRLAIDEPLLWRRIDLADEDEHCTSDSDKDVRPAGWRQMARAAIRRSAGRCESFRGPVDRRFLVHLALKATLLRRLHVTSELYMRNEEFVRMAMSKLPLLEQLVLSRGLIEEALLLAVVDSCPRLELLDAAGCYSYTPSWNLRACFPSRIKVLRLPLPLIFTVREGRYK